MPPPLSVDEALARMAALHARGEMEVGGGLRAPPFEREETDHDDFLADSIGDRLARSLAENGPQRMIELIRTHYSGDFRWESHRLGRVVVLSARPEDNEGLEDFLVREFFGTPVLKRPP